MAGWHHWLNGCESEWTPGVGDGQGGLAYCDSWDPKESDTTERLNWTELNWKKKYIERIYHPTYISPSIFCWANFPVVNKPESISQVMLFIQALLMNAKKVENDMEYTQVSLGQLQTKLFTRSFLNGESMNQTFTFSLIYSEQIVMLSLSWRIMIYKCFGELLYWNLLRFLPLYPLFLLLNSTTFLHFQSAPQAICFFLSKCGNINTSLFSFACNLLLLF